MDPPCYQGVELGTLQWLMFHHCQWPGAHLSVSSCWCHLFFEQVPEVFLRHCPSLFFFPYCPGQLRWFKNGWVDLNVSIGLSICINFGKHTELHGYGWWSRWSDGCGYLKENHHRREQKNCLAPGATPLKISNQYSRISNGVLMGWRSKTRFFFDEGLIYKLRKKPPYISIVTSSCKQNGALS